jgi:hypothetical protein
MQDLKQGAIPQAITDTSQKVEVAGVTNANPYASFSNESLYWELERIYAESDVEKQPFAESEMKARNFKSIFDLSVEVAWSKLTAMQEGGQAA